VTATAAATTADLLVRDARLLATVDDDRTEIPGGWVAVTDGAVSGVGPAGTEPPATRTIRATDCLVTPGLINTHHHIYQNLTRALRPATGQNLFGWLTTLYPLWAGLDEEASYLSAWVGLAELALGGCTTSSDHLYVHPQGAGDLVSAEITAATELGVRLHATRGSMSRSQKDGGLPPDSVVQDDEEILADSERVVKQHHDPAPLAMVRVALAPCSPFSVTPRLMRATAELAERLDVRLHTHLAEDADEDAYCERVYGCRTVDLFEDVGWGTDRAWVAHCVFPNEAEIARLGAWGTGVAHCPSSNQLLGAGLAPVAELRAAGSPVGIGCDGSASADSASLWMETRNALLLARLRHGPGALQARDALEMATRGGARCLGRDGEIGQLSVGAAGDLCVWPLDGVRAAGAWSDPIEAWLRCGPFSPRHTVIAGRSVVEDGRLTHPGEAAILRRHEAAARRIQGSLVR
jgi:cytosine/adenosine deaminase-related metal-dependent hydrolase